MPAARVDADVVVVGSGPAGSAAAIMLSSAGLRVALLGRKKTGNPVGESLSPGALGLLAQLGLRETFLAGGHRPCHANASVWGSPKITWHDFLSDPRGSGFHIDRRRFDHMVEQRAKEAGAVCFTSETPRHLQRKGNHWWVEAAADQPPLAGPYLVDASGRASSVARTQGATRVSAWNQVALVAFGQCAQASEEQFTLIEAVSEGFWYSAPLPEGGMAVGFYTDASLHEPRLASTPEGLDKLLHGTHHTRRRLQEHGVSFRSAPRFVDAGSARLDKPYGDGWLAVGDAALTYDPISAHGLTVALRSGIDAAKGLCAQLGGNSAGLASYAERLAHAFEQYRREALHVYRAEQRWPDALYWKRRHALG